MFVEKTDPQIAKLIKAEEKRQAESLDLIASENYPSKAVRQALSSIFIAKYSEGRPFKRYYGGQKIVDKMETLVEARVRQAFLLSEKWAVNVQPHSGSPANYAVLRGLLKPGDKVMSLALAHGGHLSQGAKVSLSGQDFKVVNYFLDKKGLLDYREIERLVKKEKPKMIICGFSAYSQKFSFKRFAEIAKKSKSFLLADISHIAGLVVGGVHPSPFPWADVVTSTTHKTLRGPRGAMIICRQELKNDIFKTVFPGSQGGPHNHTIAAIGVALKEAASKGFKKYAGQVVKNARVLASELKKYGFDLVSGGSENHLILVDLSNKGVGGKLAQEILEKSGIVLNKNAVPYDTRSPFDPSGIRLGTPALTSRGMKEKEMKKIAFWINEIISKKKPCSSIKKEIKLFCKKFPIHK